MQPVSNRNGYHGKSPLYLSNLFHPSAKYSTCVLLIFLVICWSSCREDFEFEPNSGNLEFSKDTVFLDTVFTNIGSSTYTLKVYNGLNEDISIPFVGLQGGTDSSYRLNVDGVAGKEFTNVPLLARDSLFVFVETTFDVAPTGENQFLNTDRILFGEGTAQQRVELVTLVKDAVFLFPRTLSDGTRETIPIGPDEAGDEILVEGFFLEPQELNFENTKPYVIYGSAAVPSGSTLSIDPGARVHFHADSGILVDSGASIQINGALSEDQEILENEVIFEGDRMEPTFADIPGQWGALWIRRGSTNNSMDHLTLKNATVGLLVEGDLTNPDPTLTLNQVQVFNNLEYNFWGTNARVTAFNSIFGGAGNTSFLIGSGGDYQLVHCTLANHWNRGPRRGNTLTIDNFQADLERADFVNCIVDGSSRLELALFQEPGQLFNFQFSNTAIKFEDTNGSFDNAPRYDFENGSLYQNILLNGTMDFERPAQNQFQIGPNSDVIDLGNPVSLPQVPTDILGTARDNDPDAGAYEFDDQN